MVSVNKEPQLSLRLKKEISFTLQIDNSVN